MPEDWFDLEEDYLWDAGGRLYKANAKIRSYRVSSLLGEVKSGLPIGNHGRIY